MIRMTGSIRRSPWLTFSLVLAAVDIREGKIADAIAAGVIDRKLLTKVMT